MPDKIFLAEDEITIAMVVTEALVLNGFDVQHETNGAGALATIGENKYDLYIVDVMLPGIDGFALAAAIRKISRSTPILFLTARTGLDDVLHGFEVGASDYLKKPFNIRELIARINALLDRKRNRSANAIGFEGYLFDKMRQFIQTPDQQIYYLSHREVELMGLLLEKKNDVLPRKDALLRIWGADNFFNARTMDVFISRLRKYFKKDPSIRIINLRGVGFKLVLPE